MASRFLPGPLVRAVGRRQSGAFRLVHAAARAATAGAATVQRGFGAGLRFDAGTNGPSGFALGTWEPEVQTVLEAELREGWIVWDIGAAQGFHAVSCARAVGPTGRVLAVEPYPPNAVLLNHNVTLNQLTNVDVREVGVGAKPGWATMIDETGDAVSVGMHLGEDSSGGVPVTTLDALSAEGFPDPNLIMMDVEGAEADVLRGGRETITRAQPMLLIEVHDTWADVRSVLQDLGYDPLGVELEDRSIATSVHILTRPLGSPTAS